MVNQFVVDLLSFFGGNLTGEVIERLLTNKQDTTFNPDPLTSARIATLLAGGAVVGGGLLARRSIRENRKKFGQGLASFGVGIAANGVSDLVADEIQKAQLIGQLNIDYEFPYTNIVRGVGFSHRAASPYVTKSERLPFQTDIGY